MDPEAVAVIMRVAGGNFCLFERLPMQIERIIEINDPHQVNKGRRRGGRENLVIGQV
jgi:hypothetical protein